MAGVAALPFDDDRLRLGRHDPPSPLRSVCPCYAAAAAGSAADAWLLQFFSISSKLGRTCAGIARRPISMAIIGAEPFKNDRISTRSTCRYSLCESAVLAIF